MIVRLLVYSIDRSIDLGFYIPADKQTFIDTPILLTAYCFTYFVFAFPFILTTSS